MSFLVFTVLGAIASFQSADWWPTVSEHTTVEKPTPAGSEWRERHQRDSFNFVPIEVPEAEHTHPTGINNSGDVVGNYTSSAGKNQSFLLKRDGTLILFEYPGSRFRSHATGINNHGDIVGFYYDAGPGKRGSPAHGFLRRKDGTFSLFDYPRTSYTFAHGINDNREVVGAYEDANGVHRGFLRQNDGSFSSLDYPEAISTIPTGINNRSEIIGYWRGPKTVQRGFLRRHDGMFVDILPDPTTFTYPKGINDDGDLVGYTGLGAFLQRKDGTLSTLDHPARFGSSGTIPTGINNRLEVVGQYQVTSGVHGFLATPMSEKHSSQTALPFMTSSLPNKRLGSDARRNHAAQQNR